MNEQFSVFFALLKDTLFCQGLLHEQFFVDSTPSVASGVGRTGSLSSLVEWAVELSSLQLLVFF